MADKPSVVENARAFQRIIAPIKAWVETFKAADTTPDNIISRAELARWAAEEALANPKMNLSHAQLQIYAAQAVRMREEVDRAPVIPATIQDINKRYEWIRQQHVDPRTMLISLMVAPEVGQGGRTGLGNNVSDFDLRYDLQRFMLDAKSAPQDGTKKILTPAEIEQSQAFAREVQQGMVALNGVQAIIAQSTQTARTVLRENSEQLRFAERDLRTETADEKRIDDRVELQNALRMSPAQLLANIKQQFAASGQTLPPQVEAAFVQQMAQIMGPQGQAVTKEVMSKGIGDMKAAITQSNAAGTDAFGKAMNGKGGAVEQARTAMSEVARAQLEYLSKIRIAKPDEDGEVPKGTMSQEDYNRAKAKILADEIATSAVYAKAGQGASAKVNPQALNATLMAMLEGAEKILLQTPEQEAAEYRAGKKGFTKEQLAEIVEVRKKLDEFKVEFKEKEGITVQQFNQVLQTAAQGRSPR